MIGLEITFDLGRYHATPWGAHVNDGAVEWPPSPWRLLRALYSASRTNTTLGDRRTAADRALQALADAPPPVYELPPTRSGHTRHYMPVKKGETDQPAKVIDSYLALDARTPLKAWWDTHLDAQAADALAATARSVGYLGRSESVCSMSLIAYLPQPSTQLTAPVTSETGTSEVDVVELLCPTPQQPLDALAISVTELRKQRRLVPPGTRHVPYGVARDTDGALSTVSASPTQPTLAMLRLRGGGRPALTEAVAVGQALRRALQSRFGGRDGGSASPTFSGRRKDQPRTDQHRHAHYLAVPDGAGPRIDRLYVWAPEGLGPDEIRALAGVTHISWPQIRGGLPCALTALGTAGELEVPRLTVGARSWRSLTPFGLVRHPKRRAGEVVDSPEDQVRSELAHRSFPIPDEVTLEKGSWHRFRSSKAGTSRLERASLVGVRIVFPEPVRGPIALGALSHYGLGLMEPVD